MAITDNLRAAYSFDTSPGLLVDASGHGYTLNNVNTVGSGTGKVNEAADYGSSNTNKVLTETTTGTGVGPIGIDFNNPFTFNFWLNQTTNPGSGASQTPFQWSDNATASRHGYMEVQIFNNAGTLQVYIARNNVSANDQVGANQTFTTGTWYMLTYRWNGSTQSLCVNANTTAVVSGASTIGGTNLVNGQGTALRIGADTVNSRYTSGLIDIFSAWDRAITNDEMTQLYNAGAGIQYPFVDVTPSGRDGRNLSLLGVG